MGLDSPEVGRYEHVRAQLRIFLGHAHLLENRRNSLMQRVVRDARLVLVRDLESL
jgi:hypothetical protein